MKRLLPYLLLALLFAGCYKDEVNLEELNFNLFDPDFTGEAFIHVNSVGLQQPQTNIWNQVMQISVDSDRFPNSTTYQLHVVCLNDTTSQVLVQVPAGSDDFTYVKSDVDLNTEYCYELSLQVQFSDTRADQHCFIAQ